MAASGLQSGLEGVVAAETRLSDVDGERGRLILAGHDVEEWAGRVSFEAACAQFLGGEEASVRAALGRGRAQAFSRIERLGDALSAEVGMDALRASVAHLPDSSTPAEVIGAIAVYAAAWWRLKKGQAPVAPDASAGHAADYLKMMLGTPPGPAEVAALDAYLVTVIDHGMNASTFTARVIASTGSDLVSSVVGAVGALKGPLHGGAPGPVLDMLEAIGSPERARNYLIAELDAGRRVMGMGHRIYRVRDPRAHVLERALERYGREAPPDSPSRGRLQLARAVEKAAEALLAERHPERALKANVEFYTAVILDAVGLDRALFTPTFTAARSVGWCAHVAEQRATGRLIRPASRYIGPRPE